jgi:hypothetical protein
MAPSSPKPASNDPPLLLLLPLVLPPMMPLLPPLLLPLLLLLPPTVGAPMLVVFPSGVPMTVSVRGSVYSS